MAPRPRYHSRFLKKVNCFLAIAIIFTAVAHFLVVNDLSTRGFVFKDLKAKTAELAADQEKMQGTISALGSYQNISQRIGNLGLVAVDSVHYVSWDQYMVAKK